MQMVGCRYVDPHRKEPCGAPVANHQLRMCSEHALKSKGMRVVKANAANANKYKDGMVLEKVSSISSKTWRTQMCRTWLKEGRCGYGFTCHYAHGDHKLRKEDDPLPSGFLPFKAVPGAPEEPPANIAAMLPAYASSPPKAESIGATEVTSTSKNDTSDDTKDVTHHQYAKIPAAEVEPEICPYCEDVFADRRWKPCGHMMCNECSIKWRHQKVQTNSIGTPCPVCRTIITGSEPLPKAVAVNGPRSTKPKSVWANPDVLAHNATKFVGSTLTLEEERAAEREARRRLKMEQERLQQQEEFDRIQRANEEARRQQDELRKQEESRKQEELRRQEEEARVLQLKRQREQAAKEQLLREQQAREQALEEQRMRDEQRIREAQEEMERLRIQKEQEVREHEERQRMFAMERAKQAHQAQLQAQQAQMQAQAQAHMQAQQAQMQAQAQAQAQSQAQQRHAGIVPPQAAAFFQSAANLPQPALDEFCIARFKAKFSELSKFQQDAAASMFRIHMSGRAARPPPGYEFRLNVPNGANPGPVAPQVQPVSPMNASNGQSMNDASNSFPGAKAAPPYPAPSSSPVPPFGMQASQVPNTVPTGMNGAAVSAAPKAADDDSDEETEAERRKREERRLLHEQKKMTREQAFAKAQSKKPATGADGGDLVFSQFELEQAREAEKKLEQEQADRLLAKKIAEEEERLASSQAEQRQAKAAPPKKHDDGKWNCSVCTFENMPLYPLCAMCMTPRSKDN